jgi:eukaryotic-like serine/threonine-protein kinase
VQKHTLDLRHLIRECPECSRRFSQDAIFCPFDGARLQIAERPDDKLDPLIGQTLDGRYALEGLLGEGGMGTVYRARHITLHRALALKVLRADLAEEPELAARFLQEAQATAAIKHPNIVSITDFGRLPHNRPYFVMELLSGRTLAALLKAGGALPARQASRIGMSIASGLSAAHAARVVHRDLKPENVFLLDDEGKELRIVDFGAAMVMGGSRLTKAGVVFGTPHYMSPEQAAGKPVDHRADIYALGIILYEMLTGRVPFEGDTYMGVLTQHMFVAPIPPSQAVPSLGGKLGAIEAVVLRALEKEPSARFSTMDELENALRDAVSARAASPSWPAPPHPSAPPPRGIADDLELPTMGEIRERLSATEGLERTSRLRHVVMAILAIALGLGIVAFAVHVYSTRSPATLATTPPTPTPTPMPTPTPTPTETPSAAVPLASASTAPTHSAAPRPSHTAKAAGTKIPSTLGPDPFEH